MPRPSTPAATQEDNAEVLALATQVAQQMGTLSPPQAFALYAQFEKHKENIQPLLDALYAQCRLQLPHTPLRHGLTALDAVAHAKRTLYKNGNFQLAVELMLLDFCQNTPERTAQA